MSVINILSKVPIFKNINSRDLNKIESILKEKKYREDDHIFSETDSGDKFYLVYQGRVKIYKLSMEGQIKTLDYLEKGDFFGEMALLDKKPRSANALAIEDTTLFIIQYDDFQKFLLKQPGILVSITKTLCERLRKADREIEAFSFSKVEDRLVLCLINLAEKYGEDTGQGTVIPLNFTHQDLGELVGTAREVVSRILKKLRDEDLVKTENKRFVIPSVLNLRKKIAG